MTALLWVGGALVALGLGLLGYAVRLALRLRGQSLPDAEARAALGRLMALNTAAVGTAFLGLALMLLGALL